MEWTTLGVAVEVVAVEVVVAEVADLLAMRTSTTKEMAFVLFELTFRVPRDVPRDRDMALKSVSEHVVSASMADEARTRG